MLVNLSSSTARTKAKTVLVNSLGAIWLVALLAVMPTTQAIAQPATVASAVDASEPETNAADIGESMPARGLTGKLLEQMMLAELRASRGDLTQAADTYAQLGQITKDSRFLRRSAQWFVQAREFDRAWAVTQGWIALAPDSQSARTLFDALALARGQYAVLETNMATRLQKARLLDAKNKNTDALFLTYEKIANTLAGAPDQKAGYAVMDKLSQTDLKTSAARTGRAAMYLQRQDFGPAATEIEASLAIDPNQPRALWVSIQLILNKPEKDATNDLIMQRLDRLIGLKQPTTPSQSEAFFLKASLLEAQGKDVQAATTYQLINKEDPRAGFDAQLRIIRLKAKAGQTAQALAQVDTLNADSDERGIALLRFKGQLQRDSKDFEGAFTTLEKGVEAFPENADVLYEHAMMADRLKNYTVMEQQLRRIITSNPRSAIALNALGYSFAERNIRLSESEELIRNALLVEPDSAMILDSLGWVLFKRGQFAQAAVELKKAFAKDPDPEIAAHLGEALWALGRKDEARAVFKAAKTKNTEHLVLNETMQRLGVLK